MKAGREEIEKFDAYLFGGMDEDEQLLFESSLATDEDLAQEFELHQLITEGISAEKEARFRAVLDQQRQDTFIGANTWGKKFTIASAAIVAMGFLAVLFAMYRTNNPLKKLAITETEQVDSEPIEQNNKVSKKEADIKANERQEDVKVSAPEEEILRVVEDDIADENEMANNELEVDSDEELEFNHDLDANDKRDEKWSPVKAESTDGVTRELENEDDAVVIAKDRLLSKETIVIEERQFSAVPSARKVDAITLSSAESSKSKKRFSKKSVESKVNNTPVDSAEKTDKEKLRVGYLDTTNVAKRKERIAVEYYKSPLNYKGYSYNERLKQISVYGLSTTNSKLVKYQNVLYLKNGENYYKMIPTSTYIKFNKVTDSILIRTLNQ